ncbi:trypsin-like peptidase domain-containing protein [Massilimicrobiota sp. An134]|uniref:S1C family serine protease n=1 Tax=Massilimicrobiota sp. An134 TaxID=1965557 RepID=UPI000B383D5F|nr:trypsin-like peptidase domain-containing protein [Massilimicrobiota sp. An134]OUQ30038.1 peptidase [Massilimicrobiota sp. An134]
MMKHMNKNKLFKIFVMLLLIVSLGCNGFLMYKVLGNQGSGHSASSSNATVQTVNYDVQSDLTDVIESAKESAVGIAVYQNNQLAGSGSGVIYKVDGKTVYVITNHHVIENAQSIEVIYSNGESVRAECLGSDEYGDIAVLKMTVNFDVSAYKVGDSDLLEAGEPVLAVGSPLGIEYAGTVTQGIVSAPSRTVSVDLNDDGREDWDMNVIQTDAAINPGNSGGALVNAAGELVGITSMKLASEEVEGMGFAIPINDAVKLVEEIIETGKVNRPTIGISAVSLDSYSSYELYMYRIQTNLNKGIYVADVQSQSPASQAGIQVGDVITQIEGKDIESYKDFLTELYSKNPGDTIKLTINRNGSTSSVNVTLGSS